MKKFIKSTAFLFALVFILSLISCRANEEEKKISIICTVFPGYDWTQNVIKGHEENFRVKYLLSSGTDVHSYEPTLSDIASLDDADLVVMVGGESEKWLIDAINNSENKNLKVFMMSDVISDKVDEYEGIHQKKEEEEGSFDEHVYLSLKNASAIVSSLTDVISTLDPEHSEEYRKNGDDYCQKLDLLYTQYKEKTDKIENKTLIFADRFPFVYLMNEFNIGFYAAFSGCSAESEASVNTIAKLIELAAQHKVSYIMVSETSDGKLGETVAKESGCNGVLVLDSIQSVSYIRISKGYDYFSAMQKNLETILVCLQGE